MISEADIHEMSKMNKAAEKNWEERVISQHVKTYTVRNLYGEDWFTNPMARKAMGEKEYDRVWSKICDDAIKDGKDQSDAMHYADEMVRAEGYGFFRASCYMLSQMSPSDDFIDTCKEQGQTEEQIQKSWEKKRLDMMDDLSETIGVTREQVIKMAENMKECIEEGLKDV